MYILQCADGSYYTGSTNNLELRFAQHQAGEGAKHTRTRLPVKLAYFEEYRRIDEAFYREKQVQGWSRKKKEALIKGAFENLKPLSMAYRDVKNVGFEKSDGGFENLSHQNLSYRNTLPNRGVRYSNPEGNVIKKQAQEREISGLKVYE